MTARDDRQRRAGLGTTLALGVWAAVGCAFVAPAFAEPPRAAPARAISEDPATAPRLAILVGRPGDRTTSLHVLTALTKGSGPLVTGPSLATLTHRPLAAITATTSGADVLVVVDEAERGDRSFSSALVRMRPRQAPQRLLTGVAHASRPLAIPGTKEVVVSRGVAATDATGARADKLTLDVVDVETGGSRALYSAVGSALFLAGVLGDEVVVDRIDARGDGSLIAVHRSTGKSRVIAPRLSPFARDFAVDAKGHAIVFADRHEADSSRWVVDRIDLSSGRRDRLHEDTSQTLAPQIWPDASLALNRDASKPLERFDLGSGVRGAVLRGAPRGVARIGAVDPSSTVVALSSSEAGALPVVSVVATGDGRAHPVVVGSSNRATIAGFVTQRGAKP